ncbi:unnamed protein product [Effrenium voratum]|nr:unnamed protein product [Effrenium voratum]
MEQQQMYEMFEEVLERQHQQLMDRLERWLQGVSEQMAPTSPSSKARLSPNLTMKSTLSDVTATGSSGLPVEINVNQLQRSLTRRRA